MKFVTVGTFKAQFSSFLEEVKRGNSVGVCYGRQKKPIAMLIPPMQASPKKQRTLGPWRGQMKIRTVDNMKMTEEELLGL